MSTIPTVPNATKAAVEDQAKLATLLEKIPVGCAVRGTGSCVGPGSRIHLGDGWAAVEAVGVLAAVRAVQSGDGASVPRGPAVVSDDWGGHRVYRLAWADDPRDVVEASLVRPVGWLDDQRVDGLGRVWVSVPEAGRDGWAEVRSVEACPAVGDLPAGCRRVTGTFRHSRGRLLAVRIAGEGEVLRITASHPVWSVDRGDWVPAGELNEGERLRAADGRAVPVLGLAEPDDDEPVFNLEVDADHCYRVGEQGVLVHNQSTPCSSLSVGYASAHWDLLTTLHMRVQNHPSAPVIDYPITRSVNVLLDRTSIRTGSYQQASQIIRNNLYGRRFYIYDGAGALVGGPARIGYNFPAAGLSGGVDTAGHIIPHLFGGSSTDFTNFFAQSTPSQNNYDDVWGHAAHLMQSNGNDTIYQLLMSGCQVCVRIVLTYRSVSQFPFNEIDPRPYRPYQIHVNLWDQGTHNRLPGRRFMNDPP